jgi:hypothetical protein
MDRIVNSDLKEAYQLLSTLDNILQKEIKLVIGNKANLDKIVPEELVKVHSLKQKDALNFVDNLYKTSYESSVVSLVAVFERIVFAKYRTSYGKIKSVVDSHAGKPLDYHKVRAKFVNGGVDKLSGIIELIEGLVSIEMLNRLKKIKEQRDYIAHGKRFGSAPAIEMSLTDIASALDGIISEIES